MIQLRKLDKAGVSSLLAACALTGSCSSQPSGGVNESAAARGGAGSAGEPAIDTGGGGSGSGGPPSSATGGGGIPPIEPSRVSVMGRFPESGASVCADAPLRLSFSAPVTVGASGKVQLFKSSAPELALDSIDVSAASTADTISGRAFNKLRPIFLDGADAVMYFKTRALAEPGRYFVSVDAGVFVDAEGAPLAPIGGPDDWQFTSLAPAPADPTRLSVAGDGTGDFCTVQGAVDYVATGNMVPTTISIASGVYREIVFIQGKHELTFRGQDRKTTIIAYPNNDLLQSKRGTAFRAMVEAEGSNGLVFENLTLHNTTPQGGSQAEALRIEPGDRATLRSADFIGLQDTLLLTGRVYVADSYVEGNVDFIWGKGTAYFERSEIKTVGRAGYLVQARNSGNYGYVFVDSTLSSSGPATSGTMLARIEVDRFPNSNVAFIDCKLGPHIAPKGWLITSSTTTTVASLDLSKLKFWEYQSTDLEGAPLDVSGRDPASRQLSALEAEALRDKSAVLGGWTP